MAKTIADLLNRYDSRKNEEILRREAWEAELYRRHPALAALEAQKKELFLRQLERVLHAPGDKDAIKEEAAREAENIQAQVDAYKEEHAIPAYCPQVICPLCGGAGYVRGILCTCIRRQAYQEVLGAQAVDSLDGSFAEFDDTIFGGQEEQRARTRAIARFLQNYALEFPHNAKRQLLFLGRAGLGKSFLLHALLKEIEPKEADICCISAGRLFDAFHQHRLGEDAGVELFYEAKVLAIDDLGSEPMTQNVTREYFFELLCRRQERGGYTFAVTNHSFEQLAERYTERVFSRLAGVSGSDVLRFTGQDLRMYRK